MDQAETAYQQLLVADPEYAPYLRRGMIYQARIEEEMAR